VAAAERRSGDSSGPASWTVGAPRSARHMRGDGLGARRTRRQLRYYVSVARRTNDMKGIGPFLLAAIDWKGGK